MAMGQIMGHGPWSQWVGPGYYLTGFPLRRKGFSRIRLHPDSAISTGKALIIPGSWVRAPPAPLSIHKG